MSNGKVLENRQYRRATWLGDEPVMMRIKYVGAYAGGKVQVTSTTLVFTHASGSGGAYEADATVDDGTTTAGTLTYAGTVPDTVDTFAELAAVINASANWECVLVDAHPTMSTETTAFALLTAAATQAKTAAGLDIHLDCSASTLFSLCIGVEGERCDLMDFVDRQSAASFSGIPDAKASLAASTTLPNIPSAEFASTNSIERVAVLARIVANITGTGGGTISLYRAKQTAASERLVGQWAFATATDKEITFDLANEEMVTEPGERWIVHAVCTTITNMTAGRLDVYGGYRPA